MTFQSIVSTRTSITYSTFYGEDLQESGEIRSVTRSFFHVLDYVHVNGAFLGFQLKAKLFS
jgi:hypothetical protein